MVQRGMRENYCFLVMRVNPGSAGIVDLVLEPVVSDLPLNFVKVCLTLKLTPCSYQQASLVEPIRDVERLPVICQCCRYKECNTNCPA